MMGIGWVHFPLEHICRGKPFIGRMLSLLEHIYWPRQIEHTDIM